MQLIVLDTGVLGQVTNPRAGGEQPPVRWLIQQLEAGNRIVVPEIADYELRRELVRGGLHQSIARLDEFVDAVTYLPLTTRAMRIAASYWANARNRGRPSAPDPALDGDVILAAQSTLLEETTESSVIVATTNVRHLADFVDARLWEDVPIEDR